MSNIAWLHTLAGNPTNSINHPIGSNDGRCVQMAGTYPVQYDELRLLGIPR